MQIIGLYGTKRSGKDTVYKLLKDSSKGFSINLRREAFADNLKQEVADDLVKSRGVLIKVERDTGLEDMHSSETAMQDFSDFDYILKNDSSLEVLKERVQNLFCQIKDQA